MAMAGTPCSGPAGSDNHEIALVQDAHAGWFQRPDGQTVA